MKKITAINNKKLIDTIINFTENRDENFRYELITSLFVKEINTGQKKFNNFLKNKFLTHKHSNKKLSMFDFIIHKVLNTPSRAINPLKDFIDLANYKMKDYNNFFKLFRSHITILNLAKQGPQQL